MGRVLHTAQQHLYCARWTVALAVGLHQSPRWCCGGTARVSTPGVSPGVLVSGIRRPGLGRRYGEPFKLGMKLRPDTSATNLSGTFAVEPPR